MAQFYGKTDADGYLTDISTNAQEGFTQYIIDDSYFESLNKYYTKIRIENGFASVPDNLPISQFEKDKASWDAQIASDRADISSQVADANSQIADLKGVLAKAQATSTLTAANVENMQKLLMKLQTASLQQQSSTASATVAPASASANSQTPASASANPSAK